MRIPLLNKGPGQLWALLALIFLQVFGASNGGVVHAQDSSEKKWKVGLGGSIESIPPFEALSRSVKVHSSGRKWGEALFLKAKYTVIGPDWDVLVKYGLVKGYHVWKNEIISSGDIYDVSHEYRGHFLSLGVSRRLWKKGVWEAHAELIVNRQKRLKKSEVGSEYAEYIGGIALPFSSPTSNVINTVLVNSLELSYGLGKSWGMEMNPFYKPYKRREEGAENKNPHYYGVELMVHYKFN